MQVSEILHLDHISVLVVRLGHGHDPAEELLRQLIQVVRNVWSVQVAAHLSDLQHEGGELGHRKQHAASFGVASLVSQPCDLYKHVAGRQVDTHIWLKNQRHAINDERGCI